jgi:hypothetical protein
MLVSATATAAKLTAKQARDLADADAKVEAAKAQYDAQIAAREKVRERLRDKLPSRTDAIAGGYLVRRTAYKYDSFSLKDFRTAGNRITATMLPFIKEQHGETWTVKRVK